MLSRQKILHVVMKGKQGMHFNITRVRTLRELTA